MRRLRWSAALVSLAAAAAAGATPMQDGLKLKAQGKYAQAAEAFESALEENPKDVDALQQLATVQGWQEQFDAAVKTWKKALALAPKNQELRLGLARVLYWKHEFPASLKELAGVLAKQPRSVEALTLRGDVLLAQGDAAQARKAYLAARALSPDDPDLEKKLGRTVKTPSGQ